MDVGIVRREWLVEMDLNLVVDIGKGDWLWILKGVV